MRLLVPTAAAAAPPVTRAPRPAELRDIAFLDNGQPAYVPIAPLLVQALGERPGVRVHTYRKARYSSPADSEVLDAIARSSRAAVVGLAC
jgi:hypothetical protein